MARAGASASSERAGELTRFFDPVTVPSTFTRSHGDDFMQEYDTLKRLVDEAADDVNKAVGGNRAAGTRVRKKMQEIKAAAQEIRKKVLEGRDTDEGGAE